MKLSAEDWADIVSMTKAAILTWQTTAETKGLPDQFAVHNANKEGRSALLTKHTLDGQEVKAVCVMRFEATGSVFPCKWDKAKRKWVPKSAPQSWIRLEGKPVEAIWKTLKLAEFTMSMARAS